MRHTMTSAFVCLASLSAGLGFLACSGGGDSGGPSAKPDGGAGFQFDFDAAKWDAWTTGSNPDASVDSGSADAAPDEAAAPDAGDSDASDPAPLDCESCGSGESATTCTNRYKDCQANAGCKRIYDCVYTYRGCGLTSSDVDCVRGCIDDYCTDYDSVVMYLGYDHCAYCSSTCEKACSSYCGGWPSGGLSTRCGAPGTEDAGPDAADGSAGTDAGSADAPPDAGHGGAGGDDPADGGGAGGNGGSAPVCVPGRQEACACVGGAQGAQVCNSSGTGFGPCYCPDPDKDGSGGGSGSGGSGGGSGGSDGGGKGGSGGDPDQGGAGSSGSGGSKQGAGGSGASDGTSDNGDQRQRATTPARYDSPYFRF